MTGAPGRRALLFGATALLLVRQAGAEEVETPAATPAPAPPVAAATPDEPAPAPRPRPRPRRARRPPPPPEPEPEPQLAAPRFDPAPVPNRDLEGPKVAPSENPSFGPSIIHRSLPSTGAARDGARNYDEERLFFPAPGARLTVPFR